MCQNIIDEHFGPENSKPIDTFEIPEDISEFSSIQRAELLVTVFHSFFFDSPNRSHEQKVAIFNRLLELDYLITERNKVRTDFVRHLQIYFGDDSD